MQKRSSDLVAEHLLDTVTTLQSAETNIRKYFNIMLITVSDKTINCYATHKVLLVIDIKVQMENLDMSRGNASPIYKRVIHNMCKLLKV